MFFIAEATIHEEGHKNKMYFYIPEDMPKDSRDVKDKLFNKAEEIYRFNNERSNDISVSLTIEDEQSKKLVNVIDREYHDILPISKEQLQEDFISSHDVWAIYH